MSERREFFCVLLAISAVLVGSWAMLPHEAFFTGDSGVKLVQIENLLASRYGSITLRYNGSDIDPQSLISPFQLKPSVYVKDGKSYSLFPLLFPFLSSFFYAAMGYAGLYVLPLGSGLLCLPLGYAIARRFVPHRPALLAMAAVGLATPVCFYSMTFWEHTPAACLFLAGIWLLLRCSSSVSQAVASGLLLGCGVWLRSEMLMLVAILYLAGLRFLGRPKAMAMSMAGAVLPLVGLAVFNRLLYGEWFGHFTRNLGVMLKQESSGLMETVNLHMGYLWTSLLGINAPQTLTAEQAGWEKSFDLIRANAPLEFLALGAIGGLAACSAIGSSLQANRSQNEKDPSPARPAGAFPLALAIQIGLLGVLAAVVIAYVLTFPQDRSPLITVLESGGVFTFSPFLAMVLIWPLLPTKDWPQAKEVRWLLYTSLACILIMPVLAPNDGGIRYGARYLLPAIALLAILAVVVFHQLCQGWGRRGFQILLGVLVALSVVIEARGYQVLYHKKVFSRDFTAALLASPGQRTAITYWWIPFEAPQALVTRKVHIIYNARATERFFQGSRLAGDSTVNVVVLGRKDRPPAVPGTVVVGRTEVVHPFDTYFNLTIFALALQPDEATPRSP
jgi:hypothetical protein